MTDWDGNWQEKLQKAFADGVPEPKLRDAKIRDYGAMKAGLNTIADFSLRWSDPKHSEFRDAHPIVEVKADESEAAKGEDIRELCKKKCGAISHRVAGTPPSDFTREIYTHCLPETLTAYAALLPVVIRDSNRAEQAQFKAQALTSAWLPIHSVGQPRRGADFTTFLEKISGIPYK